MEELRARDLSLIRSILFDPRFECNIEIGHQNLTPRVLKSVKSSVLQS